MLGQTEWYQDAAQRWVYLPNADSDAWRAAAERLLRMALPLARHVHRDLYCGGYPSGEQAQWDLERAEAYGEHVTANAENAREWLAQTPLYETLVKGVGAPETADEDDFDVPESGLPPVVSPDPLAQQKRVELSELDKTIEKVRATLQYLEELRGRLA